MPQLTVRKVFFIVSVDMATSGRRPPERLEIAEGLAEINDSHDGSPFLGAMERVLETVCAQVEQALEDLRRTISQ